ncbi:DUF6155 family protein [Mastigocoleus sp. MO_188.B34]|uniref:DUF6155 family protein n=1 Tax=Mastigocoleus sp. MO_188.B34 TaxID=3036635 RepID=UPI00263040AB|nr:DUF6155 family protein [Mastigocoleus sp. MO_188.B34]MDJ0694836.1 DUF6155 family protein [Mastigocoleus sp. MO_188.B34]
MTQPHITLSSLKKYLKTCSQEQLVNEISELFRRFPTVKQYYQIKLYPESEEQVISKYKKAIENEFLPSRGFDNAMHKSAKKAISEYKKISQTPLGLVDIMLFYVEQGVKFIKSCGDIDENFYISMEGMYEKAVTFISNHGFKDIFQERCQKIVEDTSDIGWGFHDALSEIYEESFL